jgi:hypothetical protein
MTGGEGDRMSKGQLVIHTAEGQGDFGAVMKALTLWQPWASLIAWGEKQYETRSWKTDYRGPLAIHASLRLTIEQKTVCWRAEFRTAFLRHGCLHPVELPLGKVLCVVDLVEIVRTEMAEVSEKERAFGDYAPGRFAWKLENVRPFEPQLPAQGHQGLWEWPYSLSALKLESVK